MPSPNIFFTAGLVRLLTIAHAVEYPPYPPPSPSSLPPPNETDSSTSCSAEEVGRLLEKGISVEVLPTKKQIDWSRKGLRAEDFVAMGHAITSAGELPLTLLSLHTNKMGLDAGDEPSDVGLKALGAGFGKLKELVSLGIGNNLLGDAHVEAFSKAIAPPEAVAGALTPAELLHRAAKMMTCKVAGGVARPSLLPMVGSTATIELCALAREAVTLFFEQHGPSGSLCRSPDSGKPLSQLEATGYLLGDLVRGEWLFEEGTPWATALELGAQVDAVASKEKAAQSYSKTKIIDKHKAAFKVARAQDQKTGDGSQLRALTAEVAAKIEERRVARASVRAETVVLGASGALHKLKMLALDLNRIGDVGARVLATALLRGALPALETLRLDGNQVSDDGLLALVEVAEAGGFQQLLVLNLRNNAVRGPESVQALATALNKGAFPNLGRLILYGNPCATDGFMAKSLLTGPSLARQIILDMDDSN